MWVARLVANKGALWVCGLCRSFGKDTEHMAGDCCERHSILVEEGSVKKDSAGRVVDCQAITRRPK